jgi:hypothetical protein
MKENTIMIQKLHLLKTIRVLTIFSVMAFGFIAIVGTSSDDAKDLVDYEFEKEAEFELPAVVAEKKVSSDNSSLFEAEENDCNTTTIQAELNKIEDEIKDLDKIKIKKLTLNYVKVDYTASWTPSTIQDLTCYLVVRGEKSTVLSETAINNPSGSQTLNLTDAQKEVINYYLSNRDKSFEYCVECANADNIDEYTVNYFAEIGVTIKGEF